MRVQCLACPILVFTGDLSASPAGEDLRAAYDVQTYRLDLRVEPDDKKLSGTVAVEALVTSESLATLELDLKKGFDVQTVVELPGAIVPQGPLDGTPIAFEHDGARLDCTLAAPRKKGESLRVAVTYSGHPVSKNAFDGFHWKETADKKPWICTSCQGEGSSTWWPGKDSFFHPEDKPERTFVNITVPEGLYAVSNGRLTGRDKSAASLETFHWVHEYPCETYSITLDVAPYVVVEKKLKLEGLEGPLPFIYYVLPEDADKAKLQFKDAERMLEIYSQAFGAFPFPKSKYALVETSIWGMEHSTAVAYGSSFPAWCAKQGEIDPYSSRNKFYDYVLVHESAHEWWGNAVSARTWGHFWIHEGFGTYAEGVYLEKLHDREEADRWFETIKSSIGKESKLFRGEDVDSNQAYGLVIYNKGAWVLNTLRQYVSDDPTWWKSLKDFNLEFRYKNATSDDFRAVLERNTKKSWKEFFDEWVYGAGYPELDGVVTAGARSLLVEIEDRSTSSTGFHVPLEISWRDGKDVKRERLVMQPGANSIELPCKVKPRDITVSGLEHILGYHTLRFE